MAPRPRRQKKYCSIVETRRIRVERIPHQFIRTPGRLTANAVGTDVVVLVLSSPEDEHKIGAL